MKKHREIILCLSKNLPNSVICPTLNVSRSYVARWRKISKETGKGYEELQALADAELAQLFSPVRKAPVRHEYNDPRKEEIRNEMPEILKLLSRKHATYQYVFDTYYKIKYPNGYRVTQFKKYVQEFSKKLDPAFHIEHTPGEEWQVDFAGDKLYLTDRLTKEKTPLEVLIAVMPFSNLPFMYAMPRATIDYFYEGLNQGLQFMGATPQVVKSDNMKQWVTKPDRYCPTLNQFNQEWTQYYGLAPIACRVRRPTDKGSVERAVKEMYQYVYARIERTEFHDIDTLNQRIYDLLEEFCDLPFKGSSRRQIFEEYELPNMLPLPTQMYRLFRRKTVKLGRNYHVSVDDFYYSAPYQYIGRELTIYWDAQYVDIYCGGDWLCSHEKSIYKYGYKTVDEHMPERHRAYKKEKGMNAAAYIECAGKIGPTVQWLVKSMLDKARHPQQVYRGCAGVLGLARIYSNERVEKASGIIKTAHLQTDYITLKSLLVNNIDKAPDTLKGGENTKPPVNTNVRGKDAFTCIPPVTSKKKNEDEQGKKQKDDQNKKRKDNNQNDKGKQNDE